MVLLDFLIVPVDLHLNLATWLERAVLTFSLVINFQHVLSSTKALIDDSNLPMQTHFYRSAPSIRCQNDHLFWLDLEVLMRYC